MLAALALLAAAPHSAPWKIQGQSVLFQFAQGVLRVQPCTDSVIRVTFAPGGRFSTHPSLSVIAAWPKTKFTVTRHEQTAEVKTKSAAVEVDLKTGRVALRDSHNHLRLQEASTAARAFQPVTVAGSSAFQVTDRFDLPKNQAFYGLGCLQQDCLDYTGRTLHLIRNNTIQVNPVLVSSGGYGLLWNTASATKVSLGPDLNLIPAQNLFSPEKKPGGLQGVYFSDREFKTVEKTQIDPEIDFTWTDKKQNFTARWFGFVKTGPAGRYRFSTVSDDGARLWVNGKQIVDAWVDQPPTEYEGAIDLPANSLIPIRLDFYQGGGGAAIQLKWAPPQPKQPLSIESDFADQIDYYYLAGPELDNVVAQYRQATGQAPLFGKWAYGFWQCKERYNTQQQWLDIAKGYRDRQIPIDDIVQDWFYWDPFPWGSHKFDPKRYPDPKAAIAELHDRYHLHFMISVWAKFAPGSANFDELNSKGYLFPYFGDWGGPDRYYDAYDPRARAIYWRQMRDELFSLGVDAWWLDATEPEIQPQDYATLKTTAGVGARVMNAYALETTGAVYHGQRATTDKKRVFILTRSVFTGQQRNSAACWSGDVQATWEVLRKQVASGLNFCLAGVPYWCTDIGGFFSHSPDDPAYRELFTRWYEWGTFCPIFRVHGTGANKELWRFGPQTQKVLVKFDNLRYRLMPYIYSLAWRVTSQGYTMMRALPMDFRQDQKTWRIADQFMFGPSLLISPVLQEHANSRSLYLPKSNGWFDFWTGNRLAAGQTLTRQAPIGTLPLFVKAGSILPMGPFEQWTSQKSADPIELRIYPGANADFTLYEDQGDSYAYEKGICSTIRFHWNDRSKTLTIDPRHGAYPGMLSKRTFDLVLVTAGHGAGLNPEPKPNAVVRYAGKKTQIRL